MPVVTAALLCVVRTCSARHLAHHVPESVVMIIALTVRSALEGEDLSCKYLAFVFRTYQGRQ